VVGFGKVVAVVLPEVGVEPVVKMGGVVVGVPPGEDEVAVPVAVAGVVRPESGVAGDPQATANNSSPTAKTVTLA
jgi:hypothetical protein